MSDKMVRMKELAGFLNEAGKAYYQEDREIMSNLEYDKLYDELLDLELETGIVLADSPTISVGYESLEKLPKERHESFMLSLDKTKEVEDLVSFVKDQTAIMSWKLDGLTIVLTYRDGELFKAVTRGNGETGEVITNNVKVFKNIPVVVPFQNEIVLRGEAVIKYSDFEKINEDIEDVEAKYKNPRNLCSGTVRQLNNQITAERNVHFFVFSLVKAKMEHAQNSREKQLLWLKSLGFDIVEYEMVKADTVRDAVARFGQKIKSFDIPSDGLVLTLDDSAYGVSLGKTAKFPRDSIAFKWADETMQTTLLEIEWSPSRTGLINPIAVFSPVELEGTTVSRASVHNLSVMKDLQLGIGDTIEVYKANMIIPQIAKNITKSGKISIPEECPICHGVTIIQKSNEVQHLYCINPECLAKKIKKFTLFVSRDAMNVEGLSESTLEKFIREGFITEYTDIYKLSRHKEAIVSLDGFGEKSYQKLILNIEKSREAKLECVVYSLGISNIGLSNAKMICEHFQNDFNRLKDATEDQLCAIDGIGDVIAESFASYFGKPENVMQIERLLEQLNLQDIQPEKERQIFEDLIFVITGNVEHFKNRQELKAYIEKKGGKVTGSVSKNTNYLINNDRDSGSTKNKKAKDFGIPILTELELLDL